MEAGRRDEGRNQADQVVVHVAWVAQGGCARRHDGGNLRKRSTPPLNSITCALGTITAVPTTLTDLNPDPELRVARHTILLF